MTSLLSKLPKWVTAPAAPMPKWHNDNRNRDLEYDVENYESYLVDSNGNQYEPYSMAWRYLGMYIDCDIQQEGGEDVDESNIYRRLTSRLFDSTTKTKSKSKSKPKRRDLGSDSGDDGDDCSRKVLWAAYHDPNYRGNSIGEYQFYDHMQGIWDTSTCQTGRCAKMDCHASRSKFQLIGIFKEADGLTDWAEQLFKHEGYCIWDGDKDDEEGSGSGDGNDDSSDYEFMSNRQENIAQGCTEMYLTDDDGNSVYRDVRPMQGGNITDGLYTDEDCTQRSTMSFGDYIVKWYTNYYYDQEKGEQVAEKWEYNTERWNELMTDYQVCQPCRAYNKVPMYEDEDRRRRLDDNDGEGDEEQWGYNCYDDAGYRNCNQCYKFETKTDMELASTEDLERASNQGSILAIKVDGVTYGRGGIDWHDAGSEIQTAIWIIGAVAILGILFLLGRRSILQFWGRTRSRRVQKSLREAFVDDSTSEMNPEEKSWSNGMKDELTRNRRVIEGQRREIEQIKLELDQENAIREMEWEMNQNRRREAVNENENNKPYFPPESIDLEGGRAEGRRESQSMKVECVSSDTNSDSFPLSEASGKQEEGECSEGITCIKEEKKGPVVKFDEVQEKCREESCTESKNTEGKDKVEEGQECFKGAEEEEQDSGKGEEKEQEDDDKTEQQEQVQAQVNQHQQQQETGNVDGIISENKVEVKTEQKEETPSPMHSHEIN